jgi:hypothetical protein
MDGFILQLIPDNEAGSTISYWGENENVATDINQASLFTDVSSARLQAGKLQSNYTSHSVQVLAASKGITLKPHVATSPTNSATSTI